MDQQKMKAITEELLQVEREFGKNRVAILTEGTQATFYMGQFRTKLVESFAPDDSAVLDRTRELAKKEMILVFLKTNPFGIELYKIEGMR
jgi:hypothetical protein